MSNDGVLLAKNKIISQCNRQITFIRALSKDKKNDYATCYAFLDYMLSWYKLNSEISLNALKIF